MNAADARVLLHLLRGRRRYGSAAERLEAFYAPQAAQYDAFRDRLLQGRDELVARLDPPPGAHLVELGAGTGRNLEFFGVRLDGFARIDLVDLCPALLDVARERFRDRTAVRVHMADATGWRPDGEADCVYLSYALTMIDDWEAAIDNALAMLKPGGTLGVVDFHVAPAAAQADEPRHGIFTRRFWPLWFGHDGVRPDARHLRRLRRLMPEHVWREGWARLPYLPGLRAPWYLFVGRKP